MAEAHGIDWTAIRDEAVRLLRELLRIDTTNPPGNEHAAAEFLAALLVREGFEPRLLTSQPGRTSVIARLSGSGERGPLLLQGHTDVVPADPAEWSRPPFSGDLADGCVWGRGALDMKGTVAMQLMAVILAKRLGLRPHGDVIFCAVPDEETGGFLGAGWLVDNHPELVQAEVALGEVGGYTMFLGADRYYPIQVTEKVGCQLRLRVSGASGHGSMPIRDGAMAKAGRVLDALTRNRLPAHLSPVSERFVRMLAASQPLLLGLLDPARRDGVLAELGAEGRMWEAILHNTATPTVIQGGSKTNVIPGSIEIVIDGRLLPGQRAETFIEEVRGLIGDDAEIVNVRHTPSHTEAPVDAFFEQLCDVVRELDPGARPVPAIVTGITDARHFARLGTRCYGFAPVRLNPETPFWTLFHGADERIPVDGLAFGVEAIFRVIERY
jgi:acetylornithine deacetylase/succinyl-diaminopimelate desuccinylase-like protein